jgi:hypothetical protein
MDYVNTVDIDNRFYRMLLEMKKIYITYYFRGYCKGQRIFI